MSSRSSRSIYVGNLPGDIREREVEDLFSKYGPVVQIDLKIPPRPPGYAFVEFEDPRDADDAIHGRDGYDFDGHSLRVELAHGGRRSSNDARSSYGGASRDGGDRGRGPSRRSEFRVSIHCTVLVSGLPSSASWQDLKDHMRKGGEVCFSQVYRDGRGTTGIVDYTSYEDMKYAIKKLDDTEFRNAFSRGYVRVYILMPTMLTAFFFFFFFFVALNISSYHCRFENMIQGGIREAPAVEDLILRAAAVGGATVVAAAEAGAGAGAQRLNLRVDRLQNLRQDPLVPAQSQGHHLREDGTHGLIELDFHPCPRSRSRSRSPLPSVQKEASKSPSKLSPAKSPMRSRSKSKSRSRSPSG
ncbi:hypothetical protein HID58_006327 [Brassica napus]|uniref:RRM domain-containing protein n=1 Tax=Brassica napus TaxID=3708 RepID=A0ABQ8EB40_BRANA|nr:hypothetical protein HID58_006327 [Brassica napus]